LVIGIGFMVFAMLFHKCFMKRGVFKRMDAQNLQSSVDGTGKIELLVKDGDEQVNARGNPDLGSHVMGRGAVAALDAQMLFEPAKEQFDVPAQAVEAGHEPDGYLQVVGQKNKITSVFPVEETDPAKGRGNPGTGLGQGRPADLVTATIAAGLHRTGGVASESQVVLGSKSSAGVSSPSSRSGK
jgi:hypothetical protein